ncbi:MAG: SemiSWEET family transporter [Thermoproteota archaeon]|nr:SemiSWEET family transporter [Thermoproteota archaeon]
MATIFAVSSTVPQIKKTLKTKKTDDISIWLVVVLIAGLGLWVVYGIAKYDIVLIGGNSIAVLLNSIMLFLKIKYSKNPLN